MKHTNKNFNCLLLAPVCVDKTRRSKGVGSKLIHYVIKKGKIRGYQAIFLVGDPNYYGRFGFDQASKFNIKCQHVYPKLIF